MKQKQNLENFEDESLQVIHHRRIHQSVCLSEFSESIGLDGQSKMKSKYYNQG